MREYDYSPLYGHEATRDWNSLLVWRGSQAHGTYVPPEDPDAFDDLDVIGVFVPPPEYTLGLRQAGSRGTVEIWDEPWDAVVYEYRKALSLLCKGNPNVLAMLWVPRDMWISASPEGMHLVDSRELFATKRAYPAFRGYARGQLKKMFTGSYQGYMGQRRKELFDRYGYDVKQASHLVRILRQGIEFMLEGEMNVDRTGIDADELIEIKRGEWTAEHVEGLARQLDRQLELAGEHSTLPDAPDMDLVNELAVELGRSSL